ncbi:MAG: cellulase family glycosylhydrolase, partial [Ferruginibacter sp.]|nr:cellulase family glycosylhydrolase [Ferruginibacter sp.]
ETFDTATIAREFKWAASIGMNTMRIFLHDLAYKQDPKGFIKRIETFLNIAKRFKIKPLLVLFDSCWDPFPHTGKQHEPAPFLHNSGWVQSPGADALKDTTQYPRLKKYVTDIISHFAKDQRVLGWDVWNEPDNTNGSSYNRFEPYNKVELVQALLQKVFVWARSANSSQPLTAGVWLGDWSSDEKLKPIDKLMLDQSDIISFHNYDSGEEFEKRIKWLQRYNKPILCTEYMSRGNGSTFQGSLTVAKKYNVAAINWGFVSGKSQTIFPWDSWSKKYTGEPDLWFHDIFRKDGSPYKQEEVDLIKELTKK